MKPLYAICAAATTLIPTAAFAQTKDALCKGVGFAGGNCDGGAAFENQFTTIVNLLLYLAGAVSVIVIVYGGVRYISSTGDPARVKAAKDTVVYAVIGLVVSILGFAIINFTSGAF